eukprot:CAMPEP_0179223292 /NCGR_PEP_ID=MMETSP0797-20121207/7158_1 /TAXON_ID=47934 /ORGANISM="Dinophysis acuminata, Strain DAEP01" /LENGTH=185 /DNA_ID=CAMNT_0020930155 /DNA_START=173 /DNA_END=727 /DNA_ORIENTATION=-
MSTSGGRLWVWQVQPELEVPRPVLDSLRCIPGALWRLLKLDILGRGHDLWQRLHELAWRGLLRACARSRRQHHVKVSTSEPFQVPLDGMRLRRGRHGDLYRGQHEPWRLGPAAILRVQCNCGKTLRTWGPELRARPHPGLHVAGVLRHAEGMSAASRVSGITAWAPPGPDGWGGAELAAVVEHEV